MNSSVQMTGRHRRHQQHADVRRAVAAEPAGHQQLPGARRLGLGQLLRPGRQHDEHLRADGRASRRTTSTSSAASTPAACSATSRSPTGRCSRCQKSINIVVFQRLSTRAGGEVVDASAVTRRPAAQWPSGSPRSCWPWPGCGGRRKIRGGRGEGHAGREALSGRIATFYPDDEGKRAAAVRHGDDRRRRHLPLTPRGGSAEPWWARTAWWSTGRCRSATRDGPPPPPPGPPIPIRVHGGQRHAGRRRGQSRTQANHQR